MIIFDEKQRVEDLLDNGFKSNTALLDFILLGKYLIYKGYTGNDLKIELVKILSDKQELIPASYLPTIIPKIVRVAQSNPLQENKIVNITKKEIEIINQFSEKARRIAFVYLVCYNQLFMLENELLKSGFLKEKETRTEIFYMINLPENDDSEVVISISDYRELILYYEKYMGGDIINCKECGRLVKRNSNAQIYCKECKKKKDKDKVIKFRNKI